MKEQSGFRVKKNDLLLFFSILIITISNCRAFVDNSIGTLLELSGYSLLLVQIFFSYYKLPRIYKKKYIKIPYILILIILLNIGLIPQNLTLTRKAILIFGMIAIVMISTMSEGLIENTYSIKIMAYSVLTGVLLSMFFCIIYGYPLIITVHEGTFGIYLAFNGGIKDKNISTLMIVIMMSLYIDIKYTRTLTGINMIFFSVCLIILISSNSRGAWINFLVFLLMLNYKKILNISKTNRKLFLLFSIPVAAVLTVFIYTNVIMESSTYMYRLNGFINFFKKFGDNNYRMWFGISDLVYDKDYDYVHTYRELTGWNGTLEIAWLNILIKNGFFGLIGFILIYLRAISIVLRSNDKFNKTIMLAIIIMLLASSLVETYIQTIHGLLGMYCYLLMGYFSRSIHKELGIAKLKKYARIEIGGETNE